MISLEEQIENIARSTAEDLGFRVVYIIFKNTPKALELAIEGANEEAVYIDDCVRVHKHLSTRLKVDLGPNMAYQLQVSSPGLDRPLFSIADYRRFIGKVIDLKLRQAVEVGNQQIKVLKCIIQSAPDEQHIHFTDQTQNELIIPLDLIKEARLSMKQSLA